ncbi:MAG TPA: hypothetical protein VJT49_17735 [Amycolatopsis sp.]|uniref:hypothetical protein n=1 Tax=Amycolatopsis sp. TaxID=37632 RepID=UPI002B49C899|nr:hypothetical protein [Amycolatopsis sp.]HKS46913.1 hypothetical protein [Amycolatopsis sp.]
MGKARVGAQHFEHDAAVDGLVFHQPFGELVECRAVLARCSYGEFFGLVPVTATFFACGWR